MSEHDDTLLEFWDSRFWTNPESFPSFNLLECRAQLTHIGLRFRLGKKPKQDGIDTNLFTGGQTLNYEFRAVHGAKWQNQSTCWSN